MWQNLGFFAGFSKQGRLELTVVTYNMTTGACKKGQRWPAVLGLLRQVQQGRSEPTVTTYSATISAREKAVVLGLLRQGSLAGWS